MVKQTGLIAIAVIVIVIIAAAAYMVMQPTPTPTSTPKPTSTVTPTPTPTPTPTTPKKPMDVKVAMSLKILSLDPAWGTWVSWQTCARHLYDTLYEVDDKMNLVPGLAERYTVSQDAKTWTFYLRKDVKFHDGSPMTANDVKYTFDRIIENKLGVYSLYKIIKSVEVKDNYTVVFNLNSPYSAFIRNLTSRSGGIVNKATIEKWENLYSYHANGTGAFMLKEFVPGEKLVLVANDNYWKGRPKIDTLTFIFSTEASTRVSALESGDVQVAEVISPLDADRLEKGNISKTVSIFGRAIFFFINCQKIPDKRVRQALNYAIDKESIVKNIYQGRAEVLATPVPSKIPMAYRAGPYEYNPTKARELLTAAGATNLKLKISLNPIYLYYKEISEAVQAYLKDVGIDVTLETLESGEFMSQRQKGMLDIGIQGWGTDFGAIDYFLSEWYTGVIPDTKCQYYKNDEVVRLIETARGEPDPSKQENLYTQAQKLIWDDAPFIYLSVQPTILAYSKNLNGVIALADDTFDLRSAYLS
jgi:peptide/nickel transport system substrate-binding protein